MIKNKIATEDDDDEFSGWAIGFGFLWSKFLQVVDGGGKEWP